MKKLLVLLLAMLVIGSVFSGPVRINGPGLITENAAAIAPAGVTLSAIVRQAVLNSDQAGIIHSFDVIGAVAGDSQGLFNYELLGVTGSPFMFTTALATCPGSIDFIPRDVSRSQEVISLRGSSKPAYTGNEKLFI
jgi:hypothetical protein